MAIDEAKRSAYRQHQGAMAIVISAIAIAYTLYHVLYITGLLAQAHIFIDNPLHLAAHLGPILLLTFLLMPATSKSSKKKLPWYDVVLAILGISWNLYIIINFIPLYTRTMTGYLETYEYIGSWINMLIVLEATRRVMGWVIPAIAGVFLLYSLATNYWAGFFNAPGHDWTRAGRYIGLFVTGMYGNILNISATIVIAFILFGQFLFTTGAGAWFINIAQAILGHVRGGPAKVSVVASALMGTITGSGMADAATTGVLTIPVMIKTGYRKHIAGAIEAAAANGAQIMPPVMGIAAFIMVDFLGVPYSRIVLAGILPAVAYYVALFLMVDFEAAKTGLKGIPRSELPSIRKTMGQGWQFLTALAVLLVFLLPPPIGFNYSPELSAMYAIAALIIISVFKRIVGWLREPDGITSSKLSVGIKVGLTKIALACKNTAIIMLMMTTVCAIAGIIVGAVQLTGLSYRLSMGLVAIAGGNVWYLLLLTAVTAIILGMGMTTSAVYLILAVLVAPALVDVGFSRLAAHFFVFYYGVAALITPPVAPTSYIAAGIAGASPMQVGWSATRLAIVTFIVPFIFVFHPALLMEGTLVEVIIATGYTLLASVALAAGLSGYLFGNLNIWWRLVFVASSLLIVYPGQTTTTVIGSAIIFAALVLNFILSRVTKRVAAGVK